MCVGVALSPVEHYGRPPRIFFSSPLHICQMCSTCHNTCRLFLHTRVIYSLLVFFLHRFLQLSLSFTLLFQKKKKKRSHVICKHTYTTHTHTHESSATTSTTTLFTTPVAVSFLPTTHSLCRFTGWIERSWRKKINTWKTPLGNSSVSRRENNLVRPCERQKKKKKRTAWFTEPKKKYTRFSPYISSLRTSQCHTASRNALWDEQARRYMSCQALPKFPLFLFFFKCLTHLARCAAPGCRHIGLFLAIRLSCRHA